jgi:hypothetical protein
VRIARDPLGLGAHVGASHQVCSALPRVANSAPRRALATATLTPPSGSPQPPDGSPSPGSRTTGRLARRGSHARLRGFPDTGSAPCPYPLGSPLPWVRQTHPFRSFLTPPCRLPGGGKITGGGRSGRKATPRAIFGGDLGASTVTANRYLIALSTRSALRPSNYGFLARQIRAPPSTFLEPPHRSEPGHSDTPSNGSQPRSAKWASPGPFPATTLHPAWTAFRLRNSTLPVPITGVSSPAISPRIPVRRDSRPPGRPLLRATGRGVARSRTGLTHLAVSFCWSEGITDKQNREE